ncbi:hypothetical protein BC835DRAFT_567624 [Cytidiella melzeri]|nr:hypothetical protein BC835DRAFT_567624 [Cytidiella melzeri]
MSDASVIFAVGNRISLTTKERVLTFTISKLFTPITKSVVLLARCAELGADPVVIKIYDPRFLDERFSTVPSQPSRPWTLAAERAAAELPPDAFDESQLWEDEPEQDDVGGQAKRAALWEEQFRRLSFGCFEVELGAYEHLRALQGCEIPRLYLSGVLLPSDERAILPPAIVIEYIPDAISLRDVSGDVVDARIAAGLVRAVDSFPAHGVYHGDVNHNNVLFKRSTPMRAVVIDFGCAGVREEAEDDETWQFNVDFAGDGVKLRRLLKDKGIDIVDDAVSYETGSSDVASAA